MDSNSGTIFMPSEVEESFGPCTRNPDGEIKPKNPPKESVRLTEFRLGGAVALVNEHGRTIGYFRVMFAGKKRVTLRPIPAREFPGVVHG